MELYDIYVIFHWVLGKAGRCALRIEPMAFVHAFQSLYTYTVLCCICNRVGRDGN